MSISLLGFASFLVATMAFASWIRALRRVAVAKNRGGYVAAFVMAAILGGAALSGGAGWLARTLAGVSVFVSAFFLLTVAIGGQKVGDQAIRVGDTVPCFTALDDRGQTYDSVALDGNPALIKFFRGHW